MPTANPYAGTDNEKWWQDGYDVGISHPPDPPEPPYVLETDTQTIWSEGALAGNTDGGAEGWWVHLDADGEGLKPTEPELASAGGHVAAEAGLELAGHFIKSIKGWSLLPISVYLMLLDLESFDPTWDQVRGVAAAALNKSCGDKGCSELFLPMCVTSGHSVSGDPLLDAGYWHGKLFMDFNSALPDTQAHASDNPDHATGVLRYQPSGERAIWEWLTLTSS
ncbi:hypothetical protein ACPC54_01430 [Kitasatospora sp. NPDC094028]